jgi:hypothetical protein
MLRFGSYDERTVFRCTNEAACHCDVFCARFAWDVKYGKRRAHDSSRSCCVSCVVLNLNVMHESFELWSCGAHSLTDNRCPDRQLVKCYPLILRIDIR